MLIREVILENFMSYEYARIPLMPGLNVICGPNGSGKSSILLAISVALGQAYTERSRKLSDLIRWGKDSARVTVVFDNRPVNKRRPVPEFDVDYLRVSRYIKRDGNYWFEVNFKLTTKSEVTAIMAKFGINPDNMLIIMHQNMMEDFGLTTPTQKLRMVEEAIGIAQYRTNILEAQSKLKAVLSEEESLKSLLANAEETLAYWKEEYDRYKRREKLLEERTFLERELVWAQVTRQEAAVKAWSGRIEQQRADIQNLQAETESVQNSIDTLSAVLKELRKEYLETFYTILENEREKARCQATIETHSGNLKRLTSLISDMHTGSKELSSQGLSRYLSSIGKEIQVLQSRVAELENRTSALRSKLTKLEDLSEKQTENYLEKRIRRGILDFQLKAAQEEMRNLERELRTSQKALDDLKPLISGAGTRIQTRRTPQEVSEAIKIVAIQLANIGEVSEDAEKMYLNYLDLLTELKAKAAMVSENRARVLEELEERRRKWRETLESILETVSKTYNEFLSAIGAKGSVRLINAQDIESAGLELVVGFKGAEPQVLNAYTQSGGERSSATMLFLLALQQNLKSPFRAVDEFDIHMDPRNREVISEMLLKQIGTIKDTQYVTITPGQITAIHDDIHVITVQNVSGRSEVMVIS
ncbi:MAG: AAA family ATPase [Nitrososphaerota archaeon]